MRPLALLVASCFAVGAEANPTGPTVVSGSAAFKQAGSLLQIVNTPKAIINWQSFSIGAGEITRFVQQSSSSSVLNRVTTQNPSSILGTLQSNGRVFLINPNGIVFGAGSVIDTVGLVASSLNLSNAEFLSGRMNFTATPGAGSVINQGNIGTSSGGSVYLVGPAVTNAGIITSPKGEVVLAAGNSVELVNPGTPNLRVEITAPDNQAVNLGQISADSGRVGIYAGLIRHSGSIRADSAEVGENGQIVLKATKVAVLDTASTTSASGGAISIEADRLLQAGTISTSSATGSGGAIEVNVANRILQTESAKLLADGVTNGGSIVVNAGAAPGSMLFSSATFSATGNKGGSISLLGRDITLLGAQADASGTQGGGSILVGGSFQGKDPAVPNSMTTGVNFSTVLRADAIQNGDGGKVVVWSDDATQFYGKVSARGGAQGGDGGMLEFSGKDKLVFAGMANASAPNGKPGSLLLDPKNIVIQAGGAVVSTGGLGIVQLSDPNPGADENFGQDIVVLSNGNIVVTDPNDSFTASRAGAAYLFNGASGAIQSALTGTQVDDNVSGGGITKLSTGNFLVFSPNWASGAGAVTFGTAGQGVSGAVSATNSLVGSSAGDNVGQWGISTVGAGGANYLVRSPFWGGGAGAVTFGSGTTGVVGVVGPDNSLVGANPNDHIGTGSLYSVGPGGVNYLLVSPNWSNGRGAATWGSGTTGFVATGSIRVANSLVGGTEKLGTSVNWWEQGDQIGNFGVTVLPNGNYLVRSPYWANTDSGTPVRLSGAVTFGSGTGGVSGLVGPGNSLVGERFQDLVGEFPIAILANENYVVPSAKWNGSRGAVTWGDKTIGVQGLITEQNSLVGGGGGDYVGSIGTGIYTPFRSISQVSGVFPLPTGDYVVVSNYWGVGRGAVTFAKGGSADPVASRTGVVSELNSLVGAVQNGGPNDIPVGGVWRPEYNAWCTSNTGSFVFCSAGTPNIFYPGGDKIGSGGIRIFPNGDYLVVSPLWNSVGLTPRLNPDGTVRVPVPQIWTNPDLPNPFPLGDDGEALQRVFRIVGYQWVNSATDGTNLAATEAGAVTRVSGATGNIAGTGSRGGFVDSSNSLVGATKGDRIGEFGVQILANGAGAVVRSPSWSNINPAETGVFSVANAGAVTFIPSTGSVTGVVSSANSLVGSHVGDRIGFGFGSDGCTICTLPNGNYLVMSPDWNGSRGAVTFNNVATGVIKGVLSGTDSLIGGSPGDRVGGSGAVFVGPGNANYLVLSPDWSGSTGAVTFGRGTDGVAGTVNSGNSLVGTSPNEYVGSWIERVGPGDTNYVVLSSNWSNGKGAVTFGSGATGVLGPVSSSISLVGRADWLTSSGDQVGSNGITKLEGTAGNFVINSPTWYDGAGAVTWVNGSTGRAGEVSPSNSLVGRNSLYPGRNANDQVGSGGIYTLPTTGASGNYVVSSPEWNNSRGAATFGIGAAGVVGYVDAANSLVGDTPSDGGVHTLGDRISSGGIQVLSNGNYLVRSPNWSNTNALETGGAIAYHAGAVTFGNAATGGAKGEVSSSNSLVGKWIYSPSIRTSIEDGETYTTIFGDQVGSGEVVELRDGNYVVISPEWNSGAGAVTWGSGTAGISGLVSSDNSLLANGSGTANGNGDGDLRIESLSQRSFIVSNPYANSGAGLVHVVTPGAGAPPLTGMTFGIDPAGDATVSPETIVAITTGGTQVTLQANNDITLNSNSPIDSPGSGSLTLQAGRGVLIQSNITTGGAVTLVANETEANGVVVANRDAGQGGITLAANLVGTNITLSADAMNLAAGSIQASGKVTLQQSTPGTAIRIGAGAVDVAGVALGIGSDELAKISSAGGLTFGSNALGVSGSVTVVGTTLLDSGRLSGGTLTLQSNSGGIFVDAALTSPLNTTLSTTAGGITFGTAGALSALGKAVTLSAPGGAIVRGSGATTNVTGASLVASANQGIGSAINPLRTDVATLSASNTGASVAGGIYIDNAQSLSVTGVTNAAVGGAIAIDVVNDLTLSGTVSGTGGAQIDLTAARDIVFAETGSANGVSTGAGTVTMTAGRDIQGSTSTGNDVVTTGAGGLVAIVGGQIGATNALRTSTGATGTLYLETSSAVSGAKIAVVEANALNTDRVTVATDNATAQAVSITAPSLTVGTAAFGNASDSINLAASSGAIVGGAGMVTGSTVTLSAKTGIGTEATPVKTAASTIVATNDTSGAVALSNTGDVSVTGSNTGNGAFSVVLDAGKQLSVGSGGIASNGGGVSLVADRMAIDGNVSATGAGVVALGPVSAGTIISIGGAAADSTTVLSVSTAELARITSTGGLTIGSGANTGGIQIAGSADATNVTGGTVAFTTGGSITRTGSGAISTGGTANLALNAASGIGTVGGAAINVGAVGGSVSASNTTSGDLSLNFTDATSTIKVGGASGINQLSGGALRFDASSAIEIAGDLNAASGSITLNPTGALTRSAGTLTADTINLGTGGAATSIGTGADRILVAGSSVAPTVTAKAMTGVFLEQASGDMATSSYKLDVAASGQAIELATTSGKITVDHAYSATPTTQWHTNTQDDSVSLIARGTGGNIIGNGSATLTTSGNVKLDASGGIGIGTGAAVRTSTAGTITLKTSGAGPAGDISLIEANALNTTRLPAFTTSGTGTQTVTLTSTAGPITLGADVGNASDNLTLIASAGNIVGGTGVATAAALTLDAAGGIGAGTAVKTSTTGNITLKTAGNNAAGDIALIEANALDTTRLLAFATSGTGMQTVTLTSTAGPITLGADIGNASDNLALIASAGNIAGGTGTATAKALTLDAAVGIGAGTAVKTNTTGDITLKTAGADTAGDITLVEANALDTTRLPAFTTSGSGTQSVSLTSTAGPITLGTDIGNAADKLILTAAAQDIVGGAGVVGGSTVTLNAKTGIGSVAAPVKTAAATVSATNATSGDVVIASADATSVTGSNTGSGAFNVALGADKLLTVGSAGIASNSGAVNLSADQMTIDGSVNAGAGLTTVKPVTMTGTVIKVGGAATDGSGVLAIDGTEAAKFTGTGGLAIISTGTDGIQLAGEAPFTNLTGGTVTLDTGGAITRAGTGSISAGGTAGLALNAVSGIGDIASNVGVDIGAVGGSVTATNTTSGDMFLNFTGTSAINVGGASGISQFSGGNLRFDAGGPMQITGNLSAGSGSLTLNPTGTLTRSTGTLIADTINLGTAGVTTEIGAMSVNAHRILVAGGTVEPKVSAHATTGGVLLEQTSGDIRLSKYELISPVLLELAATSGKVVVDGNLGGAGIEVQLKASAKNIVDGGGVVIGNVLLVANTGIGSVEAPVRTWGQGVAAYNSTSGDVALSMPENWMDGAAAGSNTGGGAFNISVDAGKHLSAGSIASNGGAVNLSADRMTIIGDVSAGSGVVTLKPVTAATKISVGGTVADGATILSIDSAELARILSTGGLAIGTASNSDGIQIAGPAAASNVTGGAVALATGGAITRTGTGSISTGGTAGLALNAVSGIGNIAGNSGIDIGTVGGSVTATNTTSGDMFLNFTGTTAINVGGASGISQFSGGNLRFDAGGAMQITGNLGAGGGSLTLNPTGALTRSAGTLTADTIKLGTAGTTTSVGATGAGRILVAGSSGAPTVAANATTGGVFLEQVSGDMATSSYRLDVPTAGQAIELATSGGKITVGHAYAPASGAQWQANTQDDNLKLIAQGTGKDIVGNGTATLTTSGSVTLTASGGIGTTSALRTATTGNIDLTTLGTGSAGNITLIETTNALNSNNVTLATDASAQAVSIAAPSFTMGTAAIGNSSDSIILAATAGNIAGGTGAVIGSNVTLDSVMGVGTNAARVKTAAGTLAARSTTSGGVFISEADGVTLAAIGSVTNSAKGTNIYDVTAAGTITVGTGGANANIAGSGNTSLATTGASTNNVVLNAAAGNAAGDTVISSAGSITGTGAVNGINVTLDSATGVGAGGARISTAAGTLAARSTASGGVFVSEANGVTLATIGTVANNAVGTNAYDVTAAGPITVGTGGVNTAGTGNTNLATTGIPANGVVLGAAAGNTTGDMTINSSGDIDGPGTAAGNKVTLIAGGGIGAFSGVVTKSTGMLGLTTSGQDIAGSINVFETNALNTDRVALSTHSSRQSVTLGAPTVTLGADIGNAADDLILNTSNITGGAGTATARDLTLFGAFVGRNLPAELPVKTNTSGQLQIYGSEVHVQEANSLKTSRLSGSEGWGRANLASNGSITVDADIGAGDLKLSASGGDIVGGAGTVRGSQNLDLSATGGIGIGVPVRIDAPNALSLRTGGAGNLGNIDVQAVNSLNISRIAIATNPAASSTVQSVSLGSDGSIAVGAGIIAAGDLKLSAGVDISIDRALTAGNDLSLTAGRDLNIRPSQNVTAGNDLALSAGRDLVITDAIASAGNTASASAANFFVGGGNGPAQLIGNKGGSVVVSGTTTVHGGFNSGAFAEIAGGATGALSLTTGNLVLTGGAPGAYARVLGNPDVRLSVSGRIDMTAGDFGGGYAGIGAVSPTTIYVNFPNRPSGGYSVNGVESVVFDPATSSGFVAGGSPALLGQNLLITYGAFPQSYGSNGSNGPNGLNGSNVASEVNNAMNQVVTGIGSIQWPGTIGPNGPAGNSGLTTVDVDANCPDTSGVCIVR